jgi:hypothetical protein
MKDYIRRSAKFILYIVLIFFVVLGLYPLMKYGKSLSDSLTDLLANSRFTTMFGILIVYGMLYPMIAFVKIKRHLNGSFEQNREKIERAFEKLEYVKTQDVPGKVAFRKKSQFARLVQWHEDEITLYTNENPVIISGFRKRVLRVDKLIDLELSKEE